MSLLLNDNSSIPFSFFPISKLLYNSFISSIEANLYVNNALDNEYSNLSDDNCGVSLSAIGYI